MRRQGDSNFSSQYTVISPTLDRKRSRATVTPGVLTKNVGIDGRYTGGIRRFPGMRFLRKLVDGSSNAYSDPKFFRYASIQKGNSQYILRGFVFIAENSSTSTYDLVFQYYDTESSAWTTYEITTDIGATADVDITEQGKFLYIAIEGDTPQVIYHTGSAMTSKDLGPGGLALPGAPSTSTSGTGGVLVDGDYIVAYRYKDTQRNQFSGLSEREAVTLSGGTSTQTITVSKTESGVSNNFDTVEIYRTIKIDTGVTPYAGGFLYKVGTVTLSSDSWSYEIGSTSTDAATDPIIVQNDTVDPVLEAGGEPPESGRIAHFEGVTFMGGSPGTGDTDQLARLVWSPLHVFNPENFPSDNAYRLPSVEDEIKAFAEASEFLYAFTSRSIYRISRMGPQIRIDQMHLHRGLINRDALAPVDNSLLFASESGLILLNSSSADIVQVSALDRVFAEDWAGNLDNLSISVDGALGASILLNPDLEEAVLIWHTTNCLTQLEDMAYKLSTFGPAPSSGGNDRAYFITDNCLVFYPDADRDETKLTMGGISGTVNGSATGGSTTTITDSGASFQTSGPGLQDLYVYCLSGNNAGESRLISSNTGTQITVSSAFSNAVAAGDRYSVSPIPLKVRYWPLGLNPDQGYPRYLFRRWKPTQFGLHLSNLDGDYTHNNADMTVGCYRNSGAALAASNSIALSGSPPDCFVRANQDGILLEPGIENYGSNVDFEVVALDVNGVFTLSRDVSP